MISNLPSILPPFNIKAFAIKNPFNVFLVPGKDNFFGCFKYPNVMFDSGCSSILLPFPEAMSIEEFCDIFRKDYIFKISSSDGTGLLDPLTLTIAAINPETPDFKIQLQFGELSCDHLRFHINIENAKGLLEHAKDKIDKNETTNLTNYISNMETIKKTLPNLRIKDDINYVLIGQSLFQKYHVIQFPKVMAIVEIRDAETFNWRDFQTIIMEIWKKGTYHIDQYYPEFKTFVDKNHETMKDNLIMEVNPDHIPRYKG